MFDIFPFSWPSLSKSLVVLGIVLSASSISHWRGWRIGGAPISLGGLLSPRAPPKSPTPANHAVDDYFSTDFAEDMDPLSPLSTPAARHRSAESGHTLHYDCNRNRDCDLHLTLSGGPLSRANSSFSRPPPPPPHLRRHHTSHSSTSAIASATTLSHPSPMPSHARSMSHADATTSRRDKRLSLNFPVPVQPASPGPLPTPRSARPASWVGAGPVRFDSFQPSLSSPPPAGNFFTALAAQERHVLELKEELAKAEERLKELKKQWANQEAARKGQKEGYGFHPLQPLNTNLANIGIIDDDPTGPSWMQKELERRRAIFSGQRSSNRRVFSGSRHTRTLSLLSPDKTTPDTSFPKPSERSLEDVRPSMPVRTRSSTTPDIANETAEQADQGDALVRTGKQMASDFKDGLWTFIEDLRQATVGDEAISGPGQQVRRQPSGGNIGSSSGNSLGRSKSMGHARKPRILQPSGDGSALIDIETSFWKEHGIEAPKPAVVKTNTTPQKVRSQASQNFEESWEDWETPNKEKFAPGHSSTNSSISEDRKSQCSDGSSPRTSTRYVQQKQQGQVCPSSRYRA